MRRLVLTLAILAGAASAASAAADKWTDEETSAGLKKVEQVRYALSGSLLRLRFLYALNLDCSPFEGYQFAIIKEPEHGTAEIVPYTAFPNFAKESSRFKCNERQIEGQALTYKPKDNYEGPDSFTFLELSPSGFAKETTYTFNVRSFKAKPKSAAKIEEDSMPSPPVTIRPKSK